MSSYAPFFLEGQDRTSKWVIACDHAANTVPDFVNGGSLDLPEADMNRHIAYDVGAAGVALELGRLMNAPVLNSNFSRLVIDPNRGEQDPTLLMKLYDGSIIPANRFAGAAEREERLERCYRPYHAALAELMASRTAPVLLTVHSYTPQLSGRPPRPWHVGILHADDRRLADPLITALEADTSLCVGRNEPYGGHLPNDTIDKHALRDGHLNALIEIRNDLIETEAQQKDWAARLAPVLEQALTETLASKV